MPATSVRDPALENCAEKLTAVFMTRCPVAVYRDGTPGHVMVQRAILGLLEDGYIEVGTTLFEGSRG